MKNPNTDQQETVKENTERLCFYLVHRLKSEKSKEHFTRQVLAMHPIERAYWLGKVIGSSGKRRTVAVRALRLLLT